MTPEQKAQRLEEMAAAYLEAAEYQRVEAENYGPVMLGLLQASADELAERAALLRESAAMWRERGAVPKTWRGSYWKTQGAFTMRVVQSSGRAWYWKVENGSGECVHLSYADTLPAAQAAAVAWVDAQEGK